MVMNADGSFGRSAEDASPVFPIGGLTLYWRWDSDTERIIIDFWKGPERLEWRWDELVPSKDLRFPSTVPDWSGTGHVGSRTFDYSLLSAVAELALPASDEPHFKMLGGTLACEL